MKIERNTCEFDVRITRARSFLRARISSARDCRSSCRPANILYIVFRQQLINLRLIKVCGNFALMYSSVFDDIQRLNIFHWLISVHIRMTIGIDPPSIYSFQKRRKIGWWLHPMNDCWLRANVESNTVNYFVSPLNLWNSICRPKYDALTVLFRTAEIWNVLHTKLGLSLLN